MILDFRERKININYSNLRLDVLFSHWLCLIYKIIIIKNNNVYCRSASMKSDEHLQWDVPCFYWLLDLSIML